MIKSKRTLHIIIAILFIITYVKTAHYFLKFETLEVPYKALLVFIAFYIGMILCTVFAERGYWYHGIPCYYKGKLKKYRAVINIQMDYIEVKHLNIESKVTKFKSIKDLVDYYNKIDIDTLHKNQFKKDKETQLRSHQKEVLKKLK